MKNLPNLFKLLGFTRSQVQYGYVLSGLKKQELSNLAEHHYLVTFMAWQMAEHLNGMGAKLDIKKVLQISMIHDLGELFGGDISRPYAIANPKAKKLAKAFEMENQNFLKKYLTRLDNGLWEEAMNPISDEGLIYKIADMVEVGHFLQYTGYFQPIDAQIFKKKLPEIASKIKNEIAKRETKKFVALWLKEIQGKNATQVLFD